MESIQEVINPGQRVRIFYSSCIQLAEIHAEAQATILFPHHDHWRGPRAVRGSNDVAGQHLLYLRHFFPTNCRVLPSVRLTERGAIGLYPVLQQRSITQVVVTLTENVLELLEELSELLLLQWGEIFWQWRLARGRRMR